MKRVVITGVGAKCSIANNYQDLLINLENKLPGQKQITLFKTDDLRTNIACEIEEVVDQGAYFERVTNLALDSIKDLEEHFGLKAVVDSLDGDVMFSYSSSLSGNELMMDYLASENKDNRLIYDIPSFIDKLTRSLEINGPIYTTMSACAAGTAATGVAIDAIRQGEFEAAIVGGSDVLTYFSTAGFNSLKSLAEGPCQPFDVERTGINLGEASAFFIFEELEHAKRRGATILAEVMGHCSKNEAYHITSPNPKGEGAAIAMKGAFADAGLDLASITGSIYVNMHGTGTVANDSMELLAIEDTFKDNEVYFSSTKSRTVHCIGAAGSIELAISVLSLEQKMIYTTINTQNPVETPENIHGIYGENRKVDFDYVVSNSFAFAGNTSSIVLKKYEV